MDPPREQVHPVIVTFSVAPNTKHLAGQTQSISIESDSRVVLLETLTHRKRRGCYGHAVRAEQHEDKNQAPPTPDHHLLLIHSSNQQTLHQPGGDEIQSLFARSSGDLD